MSRSERCPFCERIQEGTVDTADALAVAFSDAFPISPGHTLVAPRRHEADFFALTLHEQLAIFELGLKIVAELRARFSFDGVNLGVNGGKAAGQTIDHAHLHVVPRYAGDAADPRGGIRWILPAKAKYWQS